MTPIDAQLRHLSDLIDVDELERCLEVGPAENEREDYLALAARTLLAALRDARAETAELRARIEALCDEWGSSGFQMEADQLRAALSPAEAAG